MNKVRIGVLGCARINKAAVLDAAVEVPGLEVAAVASRDAARAADYAARHGVARSYGAYEALLADPDIDVVYNPLPNSLHAEWSIRALEAGKAVLCEKPLASNADEAGRIVEAAGRAGRPLIEAFHYRHHPVAALILETVRSGALGRLTHMRAAMKVPGGLLAADDIRFQLALAGGATMDLGAYGLNLMRWVAGAEPQVAEARAELAAPDVDAAMHARLIFPGGLTGELDCALAASEFEAGLTVEGERGRVHAVNPFLPQRGHSVTIETGGEPVVHRLDRTSTYVFQARHLVEVVRDGATIRTPGEDGVANMAAIDAVYRAAGLNPRGAPVASPA
ncbi:Gfo/Idh/MocA family oxidoreductase [Phenylobacterium sp. SCN 70-31]|uniref:Gfo/Idh/MocA family protein n=1 Tax=Phenylobacterium sp. SCN 70-31 TaxID=1660129 RepID=UPI00086A4A83|nr:Gfo/Idh/MocA family oxidoreductase [Phenylobacterium sp. SCN 70-31]ODT89924.1 MAG: hypothetical protein ABS78_00910 [Phenylobacterium sp. SCN 70-31]